MHHHSTPTLNKTTIALTLLLSLSLLSLPLSAFAGSKKREQKAIEQATMLLNQYISFEHIYSPQLATLYADDALIQTSITLKGHTPGAENASLLTIQPGVYKAKLRQLMPLAEATHDRSEYTDIAYTVVKSKAKMPNVRITATRLDVNKDYASPLTLIVGPNNDNPEASWQIHEERSEIQK